MNVKLLVGLSVIALIALFAVFLQFSMLLLAQAMVQPTQTVLVNNPQSVKMVPVTAYTLRPEETDGSPCRTALGRNIDICELSKTEQLCATWLFPLRSIIQVGDYKCLVADRPALKNAGIVDILMGSVKEALTFGRQLLPVTLVQKQI